MEVTPFMDKKTSFPPTAQAMFIERIVLPLYETMEVVEQTRVLWV